MQMKRRRASISAPGFNSFSSLAFRHMELSNDGEAVAVVVAVAVVEADADAPRSSFKLIVLIIPSAKCPVKSEPASS